MMENGAVREVPVSEVALCCLHAVRDSVQRGRLECVRFLFGSRVGQILHGFVGTIIKEIVPYTLVCKPSWYDCGLQWYTFCFPIMFHFYVFI